MCENPFTVLTKEHLVHAHVLKKEVVKFRA